MICSKCGQEHDRPGQRYCRDCHAANMRTWRKSHPLNDEQRTKDRARSIAGVERRRGRIRALPCEHCGSMEAQMHHPDYTQPRWVVWLCRPCHLAIHGTRGDHP